MATIPLQFQPTEQAPVYYYTCELREHSPKKAFKQGAAGGRGLSFTLKAATQALSSGKPFQLAK